MYTLAFLFAIYAFCSVVAVRATTQHFPHNPGLAAFAAMLWPVGVLIVAYRACTR